ncbi:probable AP2-like ethylene-responsive transcription factor CRL5 [Coccomyxa sp. Obi]|nr:probable AP2-like ethylene-responsive transcription factor CRL5 [Coccomyxa sp. Obi]
MSSPFAAAAQQEYPEEGWGVRWNEKAKRWEARAGPGAAIAEHEPPAAANPDPDADGLERVGSGDAAGSTSSDLAERPARRRTVPSRRYSPSAAQQLEDETRGRPGGPSKYRGVIWHKSNSKWEARIYDNGKQRFLGYFTSEEEAARVYDEAAMRIGGRGARTNFPAGECLSRSSSAPAELLDVGGSRGLGAAAAPAAQPKGGRLRKKPATSAGTTGAIKGSSKYRGVWKGNDVRHLGYFEDEVAAARAYDRAVLELRGPHAPTNFAPEDYGMASADTDGVDSPFLGVSWDAQAVSWKAELWDGKEYALLGHYDSEEAAARAYDRACLAQHGEAANTNYPPNDYETEMAAAALISAVQRMSDDEEEDNSDLEMSALEALASISNEAEVDSDAGDDAACSSGRNRGSKEQQEGSEQASPRGNFRRRDSGPPFEREVPPSVRLRRAMSDPIERVGSLSRRRSARLSDADAATAAAALAETSDDAVAATSVGAVTASRSARSARSGGSADAPKSSAYKGVSWHKHSQKWYAYIQAAGKMRGLGYFDHQEDAARAYDTEARKVHGKKAVVNFRMYPDDVVREPKGRGVSSSSADTSLPSLEHTVNGSASFVEEEQALARSASVSGVRGGRPGRRGGRADRAGSPTSEEVSRGTHRVGSSRSSKYRGVSWHKHRRMWQVYVHVQSQAKNSYHLGYFANEVDAAKAYDREILKVRGKDAVTNFPESELGMEKDRFSVERQLEAAPAAADGGQATEEAGTPNHASAQPLSIAISPTSQDQAMLEDGEASPTCSAFSLDTLPLRKRSRKPKHVHSTAEARSPSPSRLPKAPRKDAADARQQQRQGSPMAEGGMQLRKGGKRTGSPQKEPRAPGATMSGGGSEGGGEARASFRGVTRLERERKWVARVWNGQKQLTLGRFDTDVAAAQAYDREMLRMKGPAAVTNFPGHTYGVLGTAQNGQQRGKNLHLCAMVARNKASECKPVHFSMGNAQWMNELSVLISGGNSCVAGEGVVGESDAPSPRRPVPRAHQGSPARGFLNPSNIALGAEREAQMALPGSRSSSQYRGVTWNGAVGKWAAVVWNSDTKKPQHLGFFDIEEQAARAYDAALLKQPGPNPAVLNFPQAALPPAPSNKALALVQRPTSAGSGVSSTDVVLDVLASMTPQSASQPSGQAARQGANIEQLASLLRSGAAVPPELAQALQLMARGQHPALARSPLQASVATASPSPSPSAGPATAGALPQLDNARPESAPHLNGAAATTGQIEQTPSPMPSPLQNKPAGHLASPGASPAMDRAQRAATLGPKVQRGANTSVYRGVSLNKASGKFEARIREQGKNHYLGSFSDEAEAARAFDIAALAMRGRTAVCNFPADDSPGAGKGNSPTQRASPQGQPAAALPAAAAAAAAPPPDQAQQVCFDAEKQLWVAEAWLGSRRIPVGNFRSEIEALRAHRATLEAVSIKNEAAAPGQHQDQAVREADLRPDDIVGASQAGVQGEPNVPTGKEGAQNPVASAHGGAGPTSPSPGHAGDSLPGTAAPLYGRTVGSTVAALRGRVQQMSGTEGRAWPGPGRRSSQYKGVSWSEASAKWRSQCWDGSKVKYIGYFDGEEDAARAYDTAMLALRGNAAQTNFPASDYPADAIARAEKHVWGQPQHRGRSEEPAPAEGVKAEPGARVRVPSRRVASPTNAAGHTGRAAPPNFAYHQGTSQYKGVSWSERSRKWRAQLWHENKVNHLGFYELEEDAARAYDAAVVELRGALAGVNFPTPGTQRPLVSSRTITTCPPGGPSTTVVVEAIPRINVNPKGSSKYRGVRWHERNGKWEARIFDSNSGKQVSLGYYDSEDAAARAYDAESKRIRGPHAHVNLPLEDVPAPGRANGRGHRRRASPEGGSDDEEDSTWPVKRPRGYNPVIGRGDLQSMAAAAAVIASTRPPEPGSTKGPHTSCYRGVVWDVETQHWAVRLATRGGERRQFGMFETEEQAAIAYDAAVLELFGPYTPTNFDTEYGPAGSPVVPVPKRPRTESSAAARLDAALFLLDTAVVSPSLVGPLAGSLQDAQYNFSAGGLASDVRRAIQARLGPPQAGAPAAAATNSRNDPGMMAGGVDVPVSYGVAADVGGVNVPISSGKVAEAGGVDVPVHFGALINAAQRGNLAVGTPPRLHREPAAGSIQPGSPQSAPSQVGPQPGRSGRSPGAAKNEHAGPLHMQNEAERMKGGVGSGVGVLHVPTPLKLPVLPAAAARDRPDSAGLPAEFLMRFK